VVKKIFQRSPISVLLSFVGVLFLQNATAASPPVIGGVSPNSGPENPEPKFISTAARRAAFGKVARPI